MIVRCQPVECRSRRWDHGPGPVPARSAEGLPARQAKRRHSRCLACGVLRVVEADYTELECLSQCGMQQRYQNQNQNCNRVQKEISRKLELIRTTLIYD